MALYTRDLRSNPGSHPISSLLTAFLPADVMFSWMRQYQFLVQYSEEYDLWRAYILNEWRSRYGQCLKDLSDSEMAKVIHLYIYCYVTDQSFQLLTQEMKNRCSQDQFLEKQEERAATHRLKARLARENHAYNKPKHTGPCERITDAFTVVK